MPSYVRTEVISILMLDAIAGLVALRLWWVNLVKSEIVVPLSFQVVRRVFAWMVHVAKNGL